MRSYSTNIFDLGEPVYRKQEIANKLLGFKNSKWKLVEAEKPKPSRNNELVVDFEYPKEMSKLIDWIGKCEDAKQLDTVKSIHKHKKIVVESVNKRLDVISKPN